MVSPSMRYSWLSLTLLLAVFVAFVGTAVGTSLSLTELLARDHQRSHALRTQADLQHLLSLLLDVETGQRGYIITGELPFLRPYEAAVDELNQGYADLREELLAGGAPGVPLERLDALIRERMLQAQRNVEARRIGGAAVLRDLGPYVEGKRVMDELRYEVDRLMREQQQRIAAADTAAEDVQMRTVMLTRLLPGVGLLTLLGALLLMLVERRRRDRAESALRDLNIRLEQSVQQRTAELRQALRRIRSFAVEMDRGIETERRRLAREVHDQVGQVGTAIKMLAYSLRQKLAPTGEPLLDELQQMADEAIRAARAISASLRPPLLDELGLEPALNHYLQTLQRQSGLQTQLALPDVAELPGEQASQMFRIVQEACTNVLRHANAHMLSVTGRRVDAGQPGYELQVQDDGCGPGQVRPDAAGLRNMRERALLAGGRFEFGPAPGCGACVRVWLPLQPPHPEVAT